MVNQTPDEGCLSRATSGLCESRPGWDHREARDRIIVPILRESESAAAEHDAQTPQRHADCL